MNFVKIKTGNVEELVELQKAYKVEIGECMPINGGDFIKDVVLELREDDKKLRYSPYELFYKSEDYEDTIEKLVEQWEAILA